MLRLINDLRSIWLLAERGYDVQANSLAASIYECCLAIASISDDNDLAKKWVLHNDPIKPFMSAKDLTKKGLENYGADSRWVDELYRIYRQYCWGKHLNPFSESQGGVEFGKDTVVFVLGPVSAQFEIARAERP